VPIEDNVKKLVCGEGVGVGVGVDVGVGVFVCGCNVCMHACMYACMYVHTCYVLINPPIPYITSSPLCLLRVFAS
jgi:hypothetical protein